MNEYIIKEVAVINDNTVDKISIPIEELQTSLNKKLTLIENVTNLNDKRLLNDLGKNDIKVISAYNTGYVIDNSPDQSRHGICIMFRGLTNFEAIQYWISDNSYHRKFIDNKGEWSEWQITLNNDNILTANFANNSDNKIVIDTYNFNNILDIAKSTYNAFQLRDIPNNDINQIVQLGVYKTNTSTLNMPNRQANELFTIVVYPIYNNAGNYISNLQMQAISNMSENILYRRKIIPENDIRECSVVVKNTTTSALDIRLNNLKCDYSCAYCTVDLYNLAFDIIDETTTTNDRTVSFIDNNTNEFMLGVTYKDNELLTLFKELDNNDKVFYYSNNEWSLIDINNLPEWGDWESNLITNSDNDENTLAMFSSKNTLSSSNININDILTENLNDKYFPNNKYFNYDAKYGWNKENTSCDYTIVNPINEYVDTVTLSPTKSFFSAAYLWNGSDSFGSKYHNDIMDSMGPFNNEYITCEKWLNIGTNNDRTPIKSYNKNPLIRNVTGNITSVKNGNAITSDGSTIVTIDLYSNPKYATDKMTYFLSFKASSEKAFSNGNIVELYSNGSNRYTYVNYVNGKGLRLQMQYAGGTAGVHISTKYATIDSTPRIYTLAIYGTTGGVGFYQTNIETGEITTIDEFIPTGTIGRGSSNGHIILPAVKNGIIFESVYEEFFDIDVNTAHNGYPAPNFANIASIMNGSANNFDKEPLQHFYNKGILNGITADKIKLWDDAAKNTLSGNVLNNLLNVDGHNSGLDADKLDGVHANELFNTFTAVKNNFNELKTDGKYLVYNTNGTTLNSPNNNHPMWIAVVYHYSSYIFQIAMRAGSSTTQAYIRSSTDNGGNWTSWNKLWTTENQFYSTDKTTNNFNLATEEGRYSITNNGNAVLNSPRAGTDDDFDEWICLVYKLGAIACQIAIAVCNTPRTYIRYIAPTSSTTNLPENFDTSWHPLWNGSNDGHNSDLDADTLDGKHASDFASKADVQLAFEGIDTSDFMHVYDDSAVTELPTETGVYFYVTQNITGHEENYQLIVTKDMNGNLYYLASGFSSRKVYISGSGNSSWSSLTTNTEVSTQISNALGGFDADDFVKDYETVYSSFNLLPLQPGMFRVGNGSYLSTSNTMSNEGPVVSESTQYWACIQTRSGLNNELFMQLALHRDDGSTNWYPDIYIRGVRGTPGLEPTSDVVGTKDYSNNYIAYKAVGKWKQIGGSSTNAETATNADTVDGYHAVDLAKTSISPQTTLPLEAGVYMYTGDDIEGSGNSYLLTVAVSGTTIFYTAASVLSHKIYVANSMNGSAVVWNEITTTPTIPVLTSDPSDAADGAIWIRSDLL